MDEGRIEEMASKETFLRTLNPIEQSYFCLKFISLILNKITLKIMLNEHIQ